MDALTERVNKKEAAFLRRYEYELSIATTIHRCQAIVEQARVNLHVSSEGVLKIQEISCQRRAVIEAKLKKLKYRHGQR